VRQERIRAPGRRGRRHRRASGSRRPARTLAIVVQGGTVQGVYAERCGRLTVYLLDYDDLRGDDALAVGVVKTGVLPELAVESGLSRAVNEYRMGAAEQARHRPPVEIGDEPLPLRWERDLEPVGPANRPEGHLLGTLLIAGVPHHVEGFEVEERDGCQESVLNDSETNSGELSEIAQGPMRTVTIAGRSYVLLVTPFQD
jgi:hypothetical protein